jgi:hypothetical protein
MCDEAGNTVGDEGCDVRLQGLANPRQPEFDSSLEGGIQGYRQIERFWI